MTIEITGEDRADLVSCLVRLQEEAFETDMAEFYRISQLIRLINSAK